MNFLSVLLVLLFCVSTHAKTKKLVCATQVEECQQGSDDLGHFIKNMNQKVGKESFFNAYLFFSIMQYEKNIKDLRAMRERSLSNLRKIEKSKVSDMNEILRMKDEVKHFDKLIKEMDTNIKLGKSRSPKFREIHESRFANHKEVMLGEIKSRREYTNCGFSDDELYAITLYTGEFYQSINQLLRERGSNIPDEARAMIDTINSGLKKIAPYKGSVRRGVSLPQGVSNKYCKNCTVNEASYISSSSTKSFPGTEQMVISSKHGRYIAPLSMSEGEDEVLFLPGEKFRVSDVVDLGGQKVIRLVNID